jgi:hypothetical protein
MGAEHRSQCEVVTGEIARRWDLHRVVAITERDDKRMLAMFRHFGFELADDIDEGVVRATKQIDPE